MDLFEHTRTKFIVENEYLEEAVNRFQDMPSWTKNVRIGRNSIVSKVLLPVVLQQIRALRGVRNVHEVSKKRITFQL